MSVRVHVMEIFTTTSPRIFDECDALMDELIEREEMDPVVTDSTVSINADRGIVEVEVYAQGSDKEDAKSAGLARILAAVSSVVHVIEDQGETPPVIKSREVVVSEAVPA